MDQLHRPHPLFSLASAAGRIVAAQISNCSRFFSSCASLSSVVRSSVAVNGIMICCCWRCMFCVYCGPYNRTHFSHTHTHNIHLNARVKGFVCLVTIISHFLSLSLVPALGICGLSLSNSLCTPLPHIESHKTLCVRLTLLTY